jgi:hypothetical protein
MQGGRLRRCPTSFTLLFVFPRYPVNLEGNVKAGNLPTKASSRCQISIDGPSLAWVRPEPPTEIATDFMSSEAETS